MPDFFGNDAKFDQARALHLPLGQYAITSSGPLGIRGVRAIGDVDIIVDDPLWEDLAARYPATHDRGFERIALGDIEIFGRDSFLASRTQAPTVSHQLAMADVIDGLPFVCLMHLLYFKREILLADPTRLKHASDRRDIAAIEALLAAHPRERERRIGVLLSVTKAHIPPPHVAQTTNICGMIERSSSSSGYCQHAIICAC